MIPGFRFSGCAMATQIWYDDIVVFGKRRDVAREDGAGACEAVELAERVS
jgi:hypothetical protein